MIQTKSIFKKILPVFTAGLTFIALLLSIGNSGSISWLPPVLIFSLAGLTILLCIALPFIWQYQEDGGQIDTDRINSYLNVFIRYCIAFNIARFGWTKLFGLQFIVPNEISALPMNQQSGEWLTWYYFGYSAVFGAITAFVQIGGSYLLLFRKTMLFAVIVLFALMLNITLVNIFYHLNAGALLQSVVLTLGLAYLMFVERKVLIEIFFGANRNMPSLQVSSKLLKNTVRFSAILLSLLYVIYLKMSIG